MPPIEAELRSLMIAGLDGDATAHRQLLERLSRLLRGYYKRRFARIGRGATEAVPHDDHGGAESAHDLGKLMSRLPGKMRRVIQYVKLDGLSVAEAASRCGLSESDVKVSVHRGLRALAAAIARE